MSVNAGPERQRTANRPRSSSFPMQVQALIRSAPASLAIEEGAPVASMPDVPLSDPIA